MKIQKIEVRAVHKADEIEVSLGLEPTLIHRPALRRGKLAYNIIAVYAIATLEDGSKTFGNGLHPCNPEDGCDPTAAKKMVVNDLIRFVEEQEKYQAAIENKPAPVEEPDIEPEWPKWNNDAKTWVDSADVVYNKTVHATSKGKRPPVNKDGTFRARRQVKKDEPTVKVDMPKLVAGPGEV